MKRIVLILASLAICSASLAGGGVPGPPSKTLKVIELNEEMQIPVRISVAYLQVSTINKSKIHAVNKNLEGDLEPYKERINKAVSQIFQSHQIVHPPFTQLSSVSVLNTTAVQMTKFDQQRFNDEMMAYLFSLKLPLKTDIARLIKRMNTDLEVSFAPQSLEEQLSVINDGQIVLTGKTKITVSERLGVCSAGISMDLAIQGAPGARKVLIAGIDLEKAPEIAQFCN